MVNALNNDNGSIRPINTGVDVFGDTTSISAETFEFINASDDGVVLAVSRASGCDINSGTTIHTH